VSFHRSARFFTALAFIGCVGWGHSQQQAQTPGPLPTIKANARLVLVDVIPTDSHGNFIPDLAIGDFKVFEDGTPQTISSLEIYRPKASPSPSTVNSTVDTSNNANTTAPKPSFSEKPITVILVDSLNTDMSDQGEGRKATLKVLEGLPPGQQMIVFALGTRLHLLQPLTGNTDQLLAAVNKLTASKSLLLVTPDDKERQEDMLLDIASTGFPIAHLRQLLAENDASAQDHRVMVTCDALRQLARTVARYPGRKNLLWLSGAFPFSVGPDMRLLDPWGVQRNYSPMVRATSAILSRVNIAVYPIDVRGLIVTAIPATATSRVALAEGPTLIKERQNAAVDPQSTMQEIADQTGGKAFYNTNDLKQSIARSIDNGASYYVLSYTPPQGKPDGKFRKIRVEVARKHLSLAYRRGYYGEESGPAISDAQLARELELAMDRDSPPSTELLVNASVLSNQNGVLDARYTINQAQLRIHGLQGEPLDLNFIASLTAWDEHGKITSHLVQRVHVPLTPNLAANIEQDGVMLTIRSNSTGDYTQVRVGILDLQTGRIGITDILPAHRAK